jgi:hypothetical protein
VPDVVEARVIELFINADRRQARGVLTAVNDNVVTGIAREEFDVDNL